MSKIQRAVKRFETVKIGANDEIEIKCLGLNGKETEVVFDLIDRKDKKGALRFIVLNTLKKDDPSTTDEDYNNADLADILAVANAVTRQSGMGDMFEFSKEKKGLNSTTTELQNSENESELLKSTSLRERIVAAKHS